MNFKVGDKVVYPSQGVSVVEEISNEVLAGDEMKCYHLRLLGSESKVMVPVTNSERVGLRPLSEKKLVKKAMKRLKAAYGENSEDWKDRYPGQPRPYQDRRSRRDRWMSSCAWRRSPAARP